MTDVAEFIDDFLKHDYDPVKAHEYYMKNRKLKGRRILALAPPTMDFNDDAKLDTSRVQDRRSKNDPTRNKGKSRHDREERLEEQQRKNRELQERLESAKQSANKASPKKKKSLMDRLRDLEKKLDKAAEKISNDINYLENAKIKGRKIREAEKTEMEKKASRGRSRSNAF